MRRKGIQVIPTIFYISIFIIILFVVGALVASFPGIQERILNLLRQWFGLPISDIAVIFHFDESQGGCVVDSSNHQNDGKLGGADNCESTNDKSPYLGVSKPMVGSGAIIFDGNDYIIVSGSNEGGKKLLNMENAEGMTIDVWLLLRAPQENKKYIIYKGNSKDDCQNGKANYCLMLTQEGYLNFKVKIDSSYCPITSKKTLSDYFTHVAITYSNKTNEIRIYIQGEFDNKVECHAGKIGSSDPWDAPLIIGCKERDCTAEVTMDELRIYTRAISPEEIVMHFQGIY